MIDILNTIIIVLASMALPAYMFGFSGNKPKGYEYELMTIFTLLCLSITL